MLKKTLGMCGLVVALYSCNTKGGNSVEGILPKPGEYLTTIGNETVRLQRQEDRIYLSVYRDVSDIAYNATRRTLFEADTNGNLECFSYFYVSSPREANSRFEEPKAISTTTCDLGEIERHHQQEKFEDYLKKLRNHRTKSHPP